MHAALNECYIFPAAPAQERLWFLQKFDQRLGSAYNIATAFKIDANVNRVALQKALNFLVARHESLRTALVKTQAGIKQIIAPNLSITINYFNYVDLVNQEKENYIISEINNESCQPFDLTQPGLIRLSVYQVNRNCCYLSMTFHHIIADGISLEIFTDELIHCYDAYLKQEQPKLATLHYQFVDIMDAQSNWRSSDEYVRQQKYWQVKLENVPQQIRLSGSNELNDERTYRGAVKQYNLDLAIINKVSMLSKRLGTTNYTLLISAFCLLTHYYSNENDFLIGVPVANRYDEEMFKVIGFIANTILLRVEVTESMTIKSFILAIQNSISEYVNSQRLPYSDVVEHLHPLRTVARNSMFQLMFGYQKTNLSLALEDGSLIQRIPVNLGLSKFDLSFFVFDEKDTINFTIEYSLELFNQEWIEEFIKNYNKILFRLTDKIDAKVSKANFILPEQYTSKRTEKTIASLAAKNINSSSLSHATTATEKCLEKIWQHLLQIDKPLSINDDFFSLGGNSLMVTQLIDMFQIETGIVLSIKTIFMVPTIKLLAKNIDEMTKEVFTAPGQNAAINTALYQELSPLLIELNQ